jgi:hypothetical protein
MGQGGARLRQEMHEFSEEEGRGSLKVYRLEELDIVIMALKVENSHAFHPANEEPIAR